VLFGANVLGLAGAMAITAFSREPVEPTYYQGWVEANFVYIGPDETNDCANHKFRSDPRQSGRGALSVHGTTASVSWVKTGGYLSPARLVRPPRPTPLCQFFRSKAGVAIG
jgi:hypothetical protein